MFRNTDDSESTPVIEIVTAVDDALVEAFAGLLPQLTTSVPPPGREQLEAIVQADSATLFVGRIDGEIVGSATLALFPIPTGIRAWIEDVVVDARVRGKGVGEELVRAALGRARALGAASVHLTSRPAREAANRLYQRIGFEQRETNAYVYRF